MQVIKYPDTQNISKFLERPVIEFASLEASVQSILLDVKQDGDAAVKKFTALFDKTELETVQYPKDKLQEAAEKCPIALREAISKAAENISLFHSKQKETPQVIETMPGVKCWRKSVAIEKVGLYIPGGTAPLFSSVLMLALPAKIAGCNQVVLCTPPDKNKDIHPAIAFAALLSGVDEVFLAGGVQAIGAMAYGTESVPKVDKIFGPGNQYVTMAKQLVAKEDVAIDMPAGPSEVLVYADETALAEFVAADLLSQAEHGVDSQVVLVTNSETLVTDTMKELARQIADLPRKEIAEKALENSKVVIVQDDEKAIELINIYAPEHLILSVKNYRKIAELIINSGSVFMGNFTPESAGDYASGTNHTLPTNGFARAFSGVSLDSFVKKITFQEISQAGIQQLGPIIETMATAEELDGHKNAVSVRLQYLKKSVE